MRSVKQMWEGRPPLLAWRGCFWKETTLRFSQNHLKSQMFGGSAAGLAVNWLIYNGTGWFIGKLACLCSVWLKNWRGRQFDSVFLSRHQASIILATIRWYSAFGDILRLILQWICGLFSMVISGLIHLFFDNSFGILRQLAWWSLCGRAGLISVAYLCL